MSRRQQLGNGFAVEEAGDAVRVYRLHEGVMSAVLVPRAEFWRSVCQIMRRDEPLCDHCKQQPRALRTEQGVVCLDCACDAIKHALRRDGVFIDVCAHVSLVDGRPVCCLADQRVVHEHAP